MILQEFKENVQSGDLTMVRSVLTDYLIIDRTFKSFDEALEYAAKTLSLIQEYDGGVMEEDAAKWDKDYLNHQMVALMVNFSQKRIAHIKKVIKAVLPASREYAATVVQSTVTGNKTSVKKLTGRTVISEREIPHKNTNSFKIGSNTSVTPHTASQKVHKLSRKNTKSVSSGRTGKRVIKEVTVQTPKQSAEKSESDSFNIGTALIVGGAVVTAVGAVIVKPIVIGTGVVLVGTGCVVKVLKKK
ncbi:hypothetical protein [Clostridium tyrobutyricum]|uniref:hypothetical protein n=1 Tax=Clostridium tyrobutyricum TaxID=1519 RepID=UPI001C38E4C4|nr:hypothetical protein [Clostridium tyrobutyricum]MBV4428290.1 hypothetical protein [Clostridium tyrobutyricum]MBV4443280.1 hypothetical protein [Clostridium tyrobutyricum]